jgi:hypothetical protein
MVEVVVGYLKTQVDYGVQDITKTIKVNNMTAIKIFIDIIFWICLSGGVLITFGIVIEFLIIPKCKNTRLKKWWRRNIVDENPYDSY